MSCRVGRSKSNQITSKFSQPRSGQGSWDRQARVDLLAADLGCYIGPFIEAHGSGLDLIVDVPLVMVVNFHFPMKSMGVEWLEALQMPCTVASQEFLQQMHRL